jgi:hypothetical protein
MSIGRFASCRNNTEVRWSYHVDDAIGCKNMVKMSGF